jgi:hypothetical protein
MGDRGQRKGSSTNTTVESKRKIIRRCLGDIVLEVEKRLREVDLAFPVFLNVPRSGDAIVTMATPLDPSDSQWFLVGEIVRGILSDRLGGAKLTSHEMVCAMANAPMSAADVAAD